VRFCKNLIQFIYNRSTLQGTKLDRTHVWWCIAAYGGDVVTVGGATSHLCYVAEQNVLDWRQMLPLFVLFLQEMDVLYWQ
jgi:hypothetical protein